MKIRDKILKELNRRLQEVDWFDERELKNQELAQTFFSRIADYMNYVKSNEELASFCAGLEDERKSLQIDQELKDEGDKLIAELKKDFQILTAYFKKEKIVIIPIDQFISSGSGTLTNNQALSFGYHRLEGILQQPAHHVGDIPTYVADLWSVLGALNLDGKKAKKLQDMNDKYLKLLPAYKEKLRIQGTYIAFLRYSDYEQLLDVWKLFYQIESRDTLFSSKLKFQLGDILNSDGRIPRLSPQELSMLNKLKDKHLIAIHRFHNYLTDKLEEIKWGETIARWLISQLAPTLLAEILILVVLIILKFLGVTAPLEILISLLKP